MHKRGRRRRRKRRWLRKKSRKEEEKGRRVSDRGREGRGSVPEVGGMLHLIAGGLQGQIMEN